MTHRNIELQVALPKVTEVTKIHQQMQQQHLNQQANFEHTIQAQTEKDLTRPDNPDENRAVSDQKQHSRSLRKKQKEKQNKKQQNPQQKSPHPYKGKHVDIRL